MQANLFFLSHISFIFQHFSQPLKCSRRGQPQFFICWNFFTCALKQHLSHFSSYLTRVNVDHIFEGTSFPLNRHNMCGSQFVSIYLSFRAAQDMRPGNRMHAAQNQAERGKIILALHKYTSGMQNCASRKFILILESHRCGKVKYVNKTKNVF